MNNNTMLCVDLKTMLVKDRSLKMGKLYKGCIRLDFPAQMTGFRDDHITFLEVLPSSDGKRNPRVFNGKYINITLREDGTYRPNFKMVVIDAYFEVEKYAVEVANELIVGLNSLIDK